MYKIPPIMARRAPQPPAMIPRTKMSIPIIISDSPNSLYARAKIRAPSTIAIMPMMTLFNVPNTLGPKFWPIACNIPCTMRRTPPINDKILPHLMSSLEVIVPRVI